MIGNRGALKGPAQQRLWGEKVHIEKTVFPYHVFLGGPDPVLERSNATPSLRAREAVPSALARRRRKKRKGGKKGSTSRRQTAAPKIPVRKRRETNNFKGQKKILTKTLQRQHGEPKLCLPRPKYSKNRHDTERRMIRESLRWQRTSSAETIGERL